MATPNPNLIYRTDQTNELTFAQLDGNFAYLSQSIADITSVESASYAINADNALTASYIDAANVDGTVTNATNADNAATSSYINATNVDGQVASALNADNALTASYIDAANIDGQVASAANADNALTASYVDAVNVDGQVANAANSDNALTASYVDAANIDGTVTSASYALSASYAPASNPFPFIGDAEFSGSILVSGSIIPNTDGVSLTSSFDLGSPTAAWKDIYVSNGTINFLDGAGNVQSTLGTGNNQLTGDTFIDGNLRQGKNTTASGYFTHAEGMLTTASNSGSHSEGFGSSAIGDFSHAEGLMNVASGSYTHAEGSFNLAKGVASHAEGTGTQAIGDSSHAEGSQTTSSGTFSHAEGSSSFALGIASHAEGYGSQAVGLYSHAEGQYAIAEGQASHAEGQFSTAFGILSHAEGYQTYASGGASHTEGIGTQTVGLFAHAEGSASYAYGEYSHTEGGDTRTLGTGSHAEGLGTIAAADYQHVAGRYNITSSNPDDLFIIGNGTSNANRKNILTVSTSNIVVSGSILVSGSLIPNVNGVSSTSSFSLGSPTAAWKDIYVSNGTINFLDGAGNVQGTFGAGTNATVITGSLRVVPINPLTTFPQNNGTLLHKSYTTADCAFALFDDFLSYINPQMYYYGSLNDGVSTVLPWDKKITAYSLVNNIPVGDFSTSTVISLPPIYNTGYSTGDTVTIYNLGKTSAAYKSSGSIYLVGNMQGVTSVSGQQINGTFNQSYILSGSWGNYTQININNSATTSSIKLDPGQKATFEVVFWGTIAPTPSASMNNFYNDGYQTNFTNISPSTTYTRYLFKGIENL